MRNFDPTSQQQMALYKKVQYKKDNVKDHTDVAMIFNFLVYVQLKQKSNNQKV
jgi:hypothetical protein